MNIRKIDLSHYKRKEHFEHFLTMQDPFAEMTVQVDITDWLRRIKAAEKPFFLSFLYAVGKAANEIPELRQRIRDGGIVEYSRCGASYTTALKDGTYRYCNIRTDLPFEEYLRLAKEAQAQAEMSEHLEEDADPESYFFISCVPWVSYSGLKLPKPDPLFSVPCITWGRYRAESVPIVKEGALTEETKILIPVTLTVNHALVDGRQMADFYQALADRLAGD